MANETDYAHYGAFAWMYSADPEVHNLIDQASAEGWTAEKLAAAIQGTAWWRRTQESERNWNAEIARDPHSAQVKRDQKAEEIIRMASTMGVSLDQAHADSYADSFYRYGWTDIQLQNSILSQFEYEKGKTKGGAATIEMQLNQMASDYGITLTDNDYKGWIISIEQGYNTPDTFKAWAAQQSANLNPWAKAGLDTGLTLRDIVAPIFNKVANELEINPNMINLNDSKWTKLFQASRDPKTGAFVTPAWSDVERLIRTDPQYGWDRTQFANTEAANRAAMLLDKFGKAS